MKTHILHHENRRRMFLLLLAVLILSLAPMAFAQNAFNWGTWTAGPLTNQPRYIWYGGSNYTARTFSTLSASWTNGAHSATVITT